MKIYYRGVDAVALQVDDTFVSMNFLVIYATSLMQPRIFQIFVQINKNPPNN